ncbi:MAG: universal stress protein [Deltaproteobacteria bacterium]|nr:universal stress protein [Deltaproteobacteria bacterium]
MKILVGYDGSSAAQNALDLARKHAKAFGAEVYVLTSMVKGTERQLEDIERTESDLEGIKTFFDKDSVPCKIHLLIRGLSPGEDLVQFAKENEIDEIIVGIEKKSKVDKFIFGSNAQYVILEAHCPVVTVK